MINDFKKKLSIMIDIISAGTKLIFWFNSIEKFIFQLARVSIRYL